MKRIGWAIALAAAFLTPAAAQEPATEAAALSTAAPGAEAAPAETANANAMTADPSGIGTAAAPASEAGANTLPAASSQPFTYAAPTPGLGIPDGRYGTHDQVTEIGRFAAAFHDTWLLLLCAIISVFVLGLLLYTMVKYRRSANPTPSRTSHNTLVEVLWTVIPVVILVAIAIPSIRLMNAQYSPPPADLTIKVIGNQWYWTYQFPDNGGFEVVSNMLKEPGDPTLQAGQRARTDADGPPLLAVDERIVIPVGKVVKFLVTSNDVIHAFAVPAFWTKIDANPGQINETWAKVDRPGVYFGQCSELCGARHAYMPIAIEVVSQAQFEAWIASKGGSMAGATPAPTAAAAPATATPAAADPAAPTPSAANRATAND